MTPEKVVLNGQVFAVQDIFFVAEVRQAFRKALSAQEYQIGNRRVKRAEIDKLWNILKAADNEAKKNAWDCYANRSARQVLLVD